MGLSELPLEMLSEIGQCLGKRDLNALTQTGRRFYHALIVSLYYEDEMLHHGPGLTALQWAAEQGRLDIFRRALSLGLRLRDDTTLLSIAVTYD